MRKICANDESYGSSFGNEIIIGSGISTVIPVLARRALGLFTFWKQFAHVCPLWPGKGQVSEGWIFPERFPFPLLPSLPSVVAVIAVSIIILFLLTLAAFAIVIVIAIFIIIR